MTVSFLNGIFLHTNFYTATLGSSRAIAPVLRRDVRISSSFVGIYSQQLVILVVK
jgi:hypothetical protein